MKSVKSVVRHYPPEKTEHRNAAVDDSVRSLTPLTSLTGHDLTCAQCGAGSPGRSTQRSRVREWAGFWVHADCLRFWKGDHQ